MKKRQQAGYLRCMGLSVLLMTLVSTPPATASTDVEFNLLITAISLGAGSTLTAAIGNTVYLGEGRRPPTGWTALGYVSGGLTIIGAVAMSLGVMDGDGGGFAALLVGPPVLALGIGTIIVTVDAAAEPEESPKIAVTPIVLRGVRGGATPGLGLALTSF